MQLGTGQKKGAFVIDSMHFGEADLISMSDRLGKSPKGRPQRLATPQVQDDSLGHAVFSLFLNRLYSQFNIGNKKLNIVTP